MTTTGNREAGDRNLSTADLAAAGRQPPQGVDHDAELDNPATSRTGEGRSGAARAAKDAPMTDRAAGDRAAAERAVAADRPVGDRAVAGGRAAAADRRDVSLSDRAAVERRDEPVRSAAERAVASTAERSVRDKPATDRGAEQLEPLFSPQVAGDYRSRWAAVQSSFVDDPRRAVREGDELVAQMMKNLAESFATERGRLETQLGQAGETTTETLRVSLRRYRSFFERLLSL